MFKTCRVIFRSGTEIDADSVGNGAGIGSSAGIGSDAQASFVAQTSGSGGGSIYAFLFKTSSVDGADSVAGSVDNSAAHRQIAQESAVMEASFVAKASAVAQTSVVVEAASTLSCLRHV